MHDRSGGQWQLDLTDASEKEQNRKADKIIYF